MTLPAVYQPLGETDWHPIRLGDQPIAALWRALLAILAAPPKEIETDRLVELMKLAVKSENRAVSPACLELLQYLDKLGFDSLSIAASVNDWCVQILYTIGCLELVMGEYKAAAEHVSHAVQRLRYHNNFQPPRDMLATEALAWTLSVDLSTGLSSEYLAALHVYARLLEQPPAVCIARETDRTLLAVSLQALKRLSAWLPGESFSAPNSLSEAETLLELAYQQQLAVYALPSRLAAYAS